MEVDIRVLQPMRYAIELRQYAHLHLFRGFVGESHGKDVSVAFWVGDETLDVFYCQPERLSGAGTRFVDSQHVVSIVQWLMLSNAICMLAEEICCDYKVTKKNKLCLF
jgi:hypothetical protein